jgi:hypothetical protein
VVVVMMMIKKKRSGGFVRGRHSFISEMYEYIDCMGNTLLTRELVM